jgi:hypothetical protein
MHTKNIRTCNFNHGFFNSQQSSLNICDFCLEFQELGFREPTELIKAKFKLLGCDQCSIISNNFCQFLGKEIWEIFELRK